MKLDLKVLVAQDTRKPLRYELDLSGLEWGGEYPFAAPVRVSGSVGGFAGVAKLELQADVTIERHCDRCYALARRQDQFSFSHEIRPDGTDESEEVPIDGGILDLDELIAQDILLEMPMRFLCRADCDSLLLRD